MTEAAMIEAVRALGGSGAQQAVAVQTAPAVADPAAVDAFRAAMSADPVEKPTPIPFADRISAAWRSAQYVEQDRFQRMRSIVAPGEKRILAHTELVQLQYELATLKFNLDVTMTVARKTSDAITTLIKNG